MLLILVLFPAHQYKSISIAHLCRMPLDPAHCTSACVTIYHVVGLGGSCGEAHRPMGGNTMDEEDRDPNNLNQHLQVTWASLT